MGSVCVCSLNVRVASCPRNVALFLVAFVLLALWVGPDAFPLSKLQLA